MNIICIYHRADFDGIFCCEILRKAFGDQATYIGWDYKDPLPEIPEGAKVIMADISVEGLMHLPNLIWIDHHRTAIERYPASISGYRIDGVAACRLAWQYFFSQDPIGLPEREAYVKRKLVEPLAVRLAGEYDVWDKRDPQADLFQFGLRSRELEPWIWGNLLNLQASPAMVTTLCENGKVLEFARRKENESTIKYQGFTIEWEGLKFLACNTGRANSDLFQAGLRPEHDGCLSFAWQGPRRRSSAGLWLRGPRAAVRAGRCRVNPLTRSDMGNVCQVARSAYDVWPGREEYERKLAGSANAFTAWRHAEQAKAVGHNSLRHCTSADYRPLLAHFHRLRERYAVEAQTPALHLSQ